MHDNPYRAEEGEGGKDDPLDKPPMAATALLWLIAAVFICFGSCCGLFGFTAALNRWNDAYGRFIWDQGDGQLFFWIAAITAVLLAIGLIVLHAARK